jgi:hypothetical protein
MDDFEPLPFVNLRGGLTVPAAALRLLFDLQERGFELAAEGKAALIVRPASRLTDDDRCQIRRWKWHLRALLAYGAPKVA